MRSPDAYQGLSLPTTADSFKEVKAPSGKVIGLLKRSQIRAGVDKLERQQLPKAAVVLSIYTPKEFDPQDPKEQANEVFGAMATDIIVATAELANAGPDPVPPDHAAEVKPAGPNI